MPLCDYGCGQEAKHQFKNGKWYCSKYLAQCPLMKEKNSKSNKGRKDSYKTRKKKSSAMKGKTSPLKGKTYEQIHGIKKAKQLIRDKKLKGCMHDCTLTIEIIKKKYPFFSQIEEMRYNPNKPGEKEIQVHCKYNECENSKEKCGWFTPSSEQIKMRRSWLEREGRDLGNFYCSEECKKRCPSYYSRGTDPFKDNDLPYTEQEYQIFRIFVLERDNYKCQYCGKKAEHVHHERPQKLEPFFALDPDLSWSVCKKCHYEKAHKDECSTGKIAKINCERK